MNPNTEKQALPVDHSDVFAALLHKDYTSKVPDVIFDDGAYARIERLAKLMAAGHSTVPKHLRGNVTDCFAVAMQAHIWGMNAFVVAQKTHDVNGILGYEAQLVNAVVTSCGAVDGRFHYEYRGQGNDLECRVGAVIAGESEITWGEWLRNGDVTTRNSPLWKTNPKQQLGYLQVKNWSRMYVPGAIMGVYSDDELIQAPTSVDEISRVDLTTPVESANAVIEKINACKSMAELEILRPEVAILSGEALKLARTTYTAAKKRIAAEEEKNKTDEPDLAEVMAAISSINNAETRDIAKAMIDKMAGYDKAKAEAEYVKKIKSIRAEKSKAAAPQIDYSDWIAAIDSASNNDDLDTTIAEMPQDAFEALKGQIDKKRSTFAQSDPFEVE